MEEKTNKQKTNSNQHKQKGEFIERTLGSLNGNEERDQQLLLGKTETKSAVGTSIVGIWEPTLCSTAINMTQPYQPQGSKFQISIKESE